MPPPFVGGGVVEPCIVVVVLHCLTNGLDALVGLDERDGDEVRISRESGSVTLAA
ncbi:MAG: hypothetical protein KAW39_00890 [Thermoplasmata archaeon]|nr:hypothetical protein [Thermoplasmata archaeon]